MVESDLFLFINFIQLSRVFLNSFGLAFPPSFFPPDSGDYPRPSSKAEGRLASPVGEPTSLRGIRGYSCRES